MSYTDPTLDPNDATAQDDSNLFDIDHAATDDAIEQQLNDAAAANPPDAPTDMSADGNQRHGPLSSTPTDISPTAGIYNDIVAAQGGVPPSGPDGTVSPTDWLYKDTVNAQGGQFPQGPSTPEAAAVSGLPAGGGPHASIAATPTDPNAHFITRLGVDSTPGLPAGGASSAANAGAPGSFQQEFEKQFGFYDPRFNSQANMESNLLKGDSIIRPQAEYMAQFDPNLKAELATINGLPDFYNSQNAADWDAAHNNQLAGRVASGDLSLAAARGQGVNVPVHPVDNAHALATQGMQDSLVHTLAQMGATGFQQSFDPSGNATLNFTSASGKPQTVQATLVGYANAIEQLKQNVAAAAQPPAGGGGLPQRPAPSRTAPPRGGGGYAPPGNAGQQPAAPMMPPGYDVQNDIGSSAGYDTLAAQRLGAFDQMGPGGTRPNVPREVASAVAYSPALTPGGYSPYDQ